VSEVYIIKWQEADHEVAVDISETLDLKLRAIACHESQFPDVPAMEAHVRARCAALGKSHGHAYAETFDRILVSADVVILL
jgi:LmbE family N-acetylglucosaminyl deacetylase